MPQKHQKPIYEELLSFRHHHSGWCEICNARRTHQEAELACSSILTATQTACTTLVSFRQISDNTFAISCDRIDTLSLPAFMAPCVCAPPQFSLTGPRPQLLILMLQIGSFKLILLGGALPRGRGSWIERSSVQGIIWTGAFVLSTLIVASRKHYTVDVLVAWYVVPLVFYSSHRRWTTKRTLKDEWPHRPLPEEQPPELEGVVVITGGEVTHQSLLSDHTPDSRFIDNLRHACK